MTLLPQDLGEQIQSSLPIAQRDYSGPDLFQAERWLLENGLISETSADTLMMYGWMAKNAKSVSLKVNLDLDNGGNAPFIEYTIGLPWLHYILERYTSKLASKSGIGNKIKLYLALALGAPRPESTATTVRLLAESLLPKGFEVRVNVKPY